jgi:hypothetical protein
MHLHRSFYIREGQLNLKTSQAAARYARFSFCLTDANMDSHDEGGKKMSRLCRYIEKNPFSPVTNMRAFDVLTLDLNQTEGCASEGGTMNVGKRWW